MKINKKLVFVLLAAGIFTTANAQIQFGIKAGANFATLTGSGASGAKSVTNFNGGVLVHIPIASGFSLQPEVVYSGQGAKADDGSGGTGTLHENYINVPVLLKYSLPLGLFFETGPQLGFLTTAKFSDQGQSVDVKSSYKSTDLAWAIGAGFMTPVHLGFDLRYNLGFTNIASTANGNTSSVKNGVFQLGVFYLFGGK
jgi:hypothetical protein